MLSGDPEEAARYFDMGFTFVAVRGDLGILAQGAAKRDADLRNHLVRRAAARSMRHVERLRERRVSRRLTIMRPRDYGPTTS